MIIYICVLNKIYIYIYIYDHICSLWTQRGKYISTKWTVAEKNGVATDIKYVFGLGWKLRLHFSFHVLPFFFLVSHNIWLSLLWIVHPCTVQGSHKLHFSATFSLKMGPTVLFIHLKIISLQCFQFQFSVSAKINSIQTDPKSKTHKYSIFVEGLIFTRACVRSLGMGMGMC